MIQQGQVKLPHTGSLSVQHLLLSAAFILLLSVIAACGGGGAETPTIGNMTVPPGNAALTCSQECANRGQCGESADRGTVVLLNAEQPAVAAIEHDLAISAGTPVDVIEERSLTVVENATGAEFPVSFYRVFIPERSTEAWVAGWCILNP